MISLVRTIAPTVEPITLAQAQSQCRIDGDADDTILGTYIAAARGLIEDQTNRALLQQTWRLSRSHFPTYGWQYPGTQSGLPLSGCAGLPTRRTPDILLPRPKLIGIVSVTYRDVTGAQQTLDPATYIVSGDGEPARLSPAPGCYWPATAIGRPDAVQVTYTAGYGNVATAVPPSITLAMLMLVSHFYDNRGVTTATGGVLPLGVAELLAGETFEAFTFED